ncbi:flippase [Clostridium perfringens]
MNKLKEFLDSKLLKNSIWLMILQVFNTVVPMLTLPYITRVLGPYGYGEFSLALNWVLYFQVIVEYGFGFLGARKVAMYDESQLQQVYSKIITARVILLLVSFSLMNIIYIFSGMLFSHYMCMMLLFFMVIGTAFQLTWLFQGKQDMKFIALVNAISRTLSVILVFILVRNSDDAYLYSFLYSCTYIFSSLIGIKIAKKKYNLRFKFVSFKMAFEELKEGWALFISQAMSKILSGFGVTVLGIVSTTSIVGIYSAIYKIPYTLTIFFSPISQALFPSVSVSFSKSTDKGIDRVKKISLKIMPIFVFLALFLTVFRKQIVRIIFGSEYENYCSLIIPLCLWFVFSIVNNFLGIQMLVASGKQKEYSKVFAISAILSIVLNMVFGALWSIYGIAWATFLSELNLSLLLFFTVKRSLKDNS